MSKPELHKNGNISTILTSTSISLLLNIYCSKYILTVYYLINSIILVQDSIKVCLV